MRISDWSSDVCSSDIDFSWPCGAAGEALGMTKRKEITLNCILESTTRDGVTKRFRRVLHLDDRTQRICVIDLREKLPGERGHPMPEWEAVADIVEGVESGDRKSTRLNSSH